MFRSWADAIIKPKKKYSLETFKQLYQTLLKHPIIDDSNQVILIETLRSIAELLIWGDQNEARFFDFFFEKNIHSYFLKVLEQKTSSTVTVQLLQTLSILFENIQTETSIYYLLSNNYVNQIIIHKFDFSDEEILAYYVSFLKTLSLKLNRNTIHFFFNEHLNDFPLYTEAIKFFNHSESMIRVAVRTLTLNVFKVPDERMLRFILDRTAVPYFSNLVWFMSDQNYHLNEQVIRVGHSNKAGKLNDMMAEHIDNLYYLNDIFSMKVYAINEVLTAQVVKKLLIPLYVHSLVPNHLRPSDNDNEPRLLPNVALFLLAQVMLILTHSPIVNVLAQVLVDPTAATYLLLMDELQQDMSEVRINMHAEQPTNGTASEKAVPLSRRGGYTSASQSSTPLSSSPPRTSLSSRPQQAARPSNVGPLGPLGGSSSSLSVTPAPSSPTSTMSARSMGPPVGPDGRTRVSSDFFVFVPKPIIKLPDEATTDDKERLWKKIPNLFRQAIFDHFDASASDLNVLPAICLLFLILKNTSVDPKILQDATLFPRQRSKVKALLDALTSSDTIPKEPTAQSSPASSRRASLATEEPLTDEHPKLNGHTNGNDVIVVESETDETLPVASSSVALPPSQAITTKKALHARRSSELEPAFDDPLQATPPSSLNHVFQPVRPSSIADSQTSSRRSSIRLNNRPVSEAEDLLPYNAEIVERLLRNLLPCFATCRSVTIAGAINTLLQLVHTKGSSNCLTAPHYQLFRESEELLKAMICQIMTATPDLFLDTFEEQVRVHRDVELARLVMDTSVALPPTSTPVPGLDLTKRLPSNELERIRKCIHDFLILRQFRNKLFNQPDEVLFPLVEPLVPIQANDLLDLTTMNGVRCTVSDKDGYKHTRFLVVDDYRLILAEADPNRFGWGVVREVSPLPSVLVDYDKRTQVVLDVTVTQSLSGTPVRGKPSPAWSAKFHFDEPAECRAAKHYLDTGRVALRNNKLTRLNNFIQSTVTVT